MFQVRVVEVCPVLQVSPVREVRRETMALQEFLCQDPQDVQVPLAPKVSRELLDLQAFPLEEAIVSLESLDVLVSREREVTQEKQARKVRKVTPV